MTKREIKKHLDYQNYMTNVNYNWWVGQIMMTLAEIDFLERQVVVNKRQTKRLQFLQSRRDYLTKKTGFEEKSVKQLNKRTKRYQELYQ